MPLLDTLLQAAGQLAVDFLRRELTNPKGWEADPRTRTIRRKRPRPPASSTRSTPSSAEPEVLDLCPRCYAYHPGKPCRRNG